MEDQLKKRRESRQSAQSDCLGTWRLAEARSQFDNLFFGVMGVTNAFLPHFRERKSGTIINISSFGSVTSTPGAGVYCAAKAAVDSASATGDFLELKRSRFVGYLGTRTGSVECALCEHSGESLHP